jgi:hypothetical protein
LRTRATCAQILLLTSALLISSGPLGAVSFLTFDPRSVAMAGTGVATARPHNASLFNPALTLNHAMHPDHRLGLHGYGGARLIDRDNFIGSANAFQRKYDGASLRHVIDDLVDLRHINLDSGPELRRATAAVDEVLADINRLSNRPLRASASAGIAVSWQTHRFAIGGHHRRYLVLGSVIEIAQSDNAAVRRAAHTVELLADATDHGDALYALVQQARDGDYEISLDELRASSRALYETLVALNEYVAIETMLADVVEGTFREKRLGSYLYEPLPTEFHSRVDSEGADVAEYAVTAATHVGERWHLGASVKLLEFNTVRFSQAINSFDLNAYRDTAHRQRYTRINADLGLLFNMTDHWQLGLVVRNLVAYDLRTVAGSRIPVRPIARAGLGYTGRRLRLSADVDLTRNEPLGFDPNKQFVSLGLEYFAWRNTALRAGVRHNLVDGERLPSIGFGFGGRRGHLDVALARSPNQDEWAVGLGFGVSL